MRVKQSLLWLGALLCLQQVALGQSFNYVTISDPNAFSMTDGFGMNDAGQIVGSEDAGGLVGGFLYSNGAFTPINDSLGTTNPYSLNDRGQIVGYYIGPNTMGQNNGEHGFIYQNGDFREFDAFGSKSGTILYGINNRGVMVGTYTNAQGQNISFITNGEKSRPFQLPNSQQTEVRGINDFGHLSGSYIDASGEHSYAFLYLKGQLVTLAYPGARQTFGAALNDLDEVVGTYLDSNFNTHGFLYENSTYTTIDFPGGTTTDPSGINNAGQISGSVTLTSPYFHTVTFVATPKETPDLSQ